MGADNARRSPTRGRGLDCRRDDRDRTAAFRARVATLEPADTSTAGNPLFAVILEEIGGPRRLRVVMQKPGADGIAVHLQGMSIDRPMTYAVMSNLVEALGGQLLESRITRTDGATI